MRKKTNHWNVKNPTPSIFLCVIVYYKTLEKLKFDLFWAHWLRLWPHIYIHICIYLFMYLYLYIFLFSSTRGRGRGSLTRQEEGGRGLFFLKTRGGGGSPRRRGRGAEGPGACLWRIGGGGGGLTFFLFGAEIPTKLVTTLIMKHLSGKMSAETLFCFAGTTPNFKRTVRGLSLQFWVPILGVAPRIGFSYHGVLRRGFPEGAQNAASESATPQACVLFFSIGEEKGAQTQTFESRYLPVGWGSSTWRGGGQKFGMSLETQGKMTGHIGTNTPKFVPSRWRWPPFDPTQTGLCKFGWVWSSLTVAPSLLCNAFWRQNLGCSELHQGIMKRDDLSWSMFY